MFCTTALIVSALVWRDEPHFAWFTWLVIVLGAGLLGVLAWEQAMNEIAGKTMAQRTVLARRGRRRLGAMLFVYACFGALIYLAAVVTHSFWLVIGMMVTFIAIRIIASARRSGRSDR